MASLTLQLTERVAEVGIEPTISRKSIWRVTGTPLRGIKRPISCEQSLAF